MFASEAVFLFRILLWSTLLGYLALWLVKYRRIRCRKYKCFLLHAVFQFLAIAVFAFCFSPARLQALAEGAVISAPNSVWLLASAVLFLIALGWLLQGAFSPAPKEEEEIESAQKNQTFRYL